MKKLLIVLLLMAGCLGVWAQKVPTNKYGVRYGDSMFYTAMVGNFRAGLSVTIDSNTRWIEYTSIVANQPANNYVFLEGAQTIGLRISTPQDSASYYRYSIFDNAGKAVVLDQKLNTANADYYNHIALFNLGKFNIDRSSITIKLYNINYRSNVSSVVIYNKPVKPAQLKFTALYLTDKKGESGVEMKKQPDGFKFKLHDSLDVSGILLAIKSVDVTFTYHIYLKNLSTGKTTRIGNNWNYRYMGALAYQVIDASLFQQPGKYELSIVPALFNSFVVRRSFPSKAVKMHFTVLEPEKTYSRKQFMLWLSLGILAVAAVSAAIIILQKRRNAKRVSQEKNQKLQAQMQLNGVRAQLNPHFVFNALAGIQNLMNNQQTDQANRYLSKFARLTRSVLDSRDFITLADELALLNDYLEMEKLRFGFTYRIDADPDLDAANLEIPAMLLQPLVENAVKHGVAGLGTDGIIKLDFYKEENNMVLSVTDNGKGYNSAQPTAGMGLKLTHDRINLLNKLHPATPIDLTITTPYTGTRIIITLNHWL